MKIYNSRNNNRSFTIRLQNWSAPAIFSVLIIICMIIIYCCETLGIAHKESNLIYRLNSIDKVVLKTHINDYVGLSNDRSNANIHLTDAFISIKEKEKRYNKMRNIISSGMIDQLIYETNQC